MSLLTDRQHVAVLVGALVLLLAWRGYRLLRPSWAGRCPLRNLAVGTAGFGSIVAFYGFGVLGARPMAAIETADLELAIVDFHSHTDSSHDGRSGLDVGVRRAWHRAAGFDLVYVTDHTTIEAGLEAAKDNPRRAGDGISLLPGREVVFRQQHVLVLGDHDPNETIPYDVRWPTLIQTIPNDLSRVPIPEHGRHEGVHAIELVDGDPRALRQTLEEREHILALADSLDLALIAGSNHHGWGRAAAAWTLIRVPGWRELPPAEVGRRVEVEIRRGRGTGARIVERPRLSGGTSDESTVVAAMAFPRLGWHVLTGLTPAERIAWLGWIASAALLVRMRSRRRTRSRPAVSEAVHR